MMHPEGDLILVGGEKTYPLIKIGVVGSWTGRRGFEKARVFLQQSYHYTHWHKVMLNYLEAVWEDYEKAFQS
jgi:hypothetical protein